MTPKDLEKRNDVDVLTTPGRKMPESITDLEGKVYQIGKVSLKKEAQIIKLLKDSMKGAFTGATEPSVALEVLAAFPELYGKVSAILLDKSFEEVEELFDLKSLKELVDPFFETFLNTLTTGPIFTKTTEIPTPSTEQSPTSDTSTGGPLTIH